MSTENAISLWPKDISTVVRSPLTIIKAQAELLSSATNGILIGEVEQETKGDMVQIRLVIYAPAYNGYRHTLVVLAHDINYPYPVTVTAESVREVSTELVEEISFGGQLQKKYVKKTTYPKATSEYKLIDVLAKVLSSEQSRAVISSLIAKSSGQ